MNVLLDLDDTLYSCARGEDESKKAVVSAIASALGLPEPDVLAVWRSARDAVKARLGGNTGSSHSRLLYVADMLHTLGRPDALARAREWERLYWRTYIEVSSLRPRAIAFLDALARTNAKIAIVTDLTLEVQLWKLERFELLRWVHAIAASEEVPLDKPDEAIFRLGAARLGVPLETCVMIGDREEKDGEGARRAGIPYHRIARDEDFDTVARALGIE